MDCAVVVIARIVIACFFHVLYIRPGSCYAKQIHRHPTLNTFSYWLTTFCLTLLLLYRFDSHV